MPDPDRLFAERLEERLRELRKWGWEDSRDGSGERGKGQITPRMRSGAGQAVHRAPGPLSARPASRTAALVPEQGVEGLPLRRPLVGPSPPVLTLFALVAALLPSAGAGLGGADVAGLLSAAAAAGVAWQEVRRHGPLTYAHSLIEQDLETTRIAMSTTVTQGGWAEAVEQAERLMSPAHAGGWCGSAADGAGG
ncbi:hypothetical protein ACRAWF_25110 [Streptomyces sp. L7]